MFIESFNQTIDIWIQALEQYSFTQLCTRPAVKSWSPGQLYLHLINDTHYYIEQIKTCITTNDNSMEKASPGATIMFCNNEFPDAIIEGHPDNSLIPQPGSKEQLLHSLIKLKDEINRVDSLISTSVFKGKTNHPGFNYLGAGEWFQLAEMHFRHHLRQKKRMDDFLKANR